ncbi:MAG: FHA domain-containing protein [Polyangiaceae bacterium]|nr:FHA domain-containing protein [Polyangiaceae bacterium]
MALFDKIFGKSRPLAAAKAAELRGDLVRAAELFGEAGQPEQAARIMLLRGDSERDPRLRLQFYVQASELTPRTAEAHKEARRKHAELLLALTGDAAVSAIARHEIIEAARELEDAGELAKAAEAYARAGDKVGEARALEAAGDVDRLEFLLTTEQHNERLSRLRDDRTNEVAFLMSCGRRREALAALDELLARADRTEEASLRERANALRARRVMAPVVVVETGSERWKIVLGDEVVIGRSEGSIKIMSNAVSRRHLRIAREGPDVVVRDLDTRNGTQLRGINVKGTLPIKDGLELKLGREVSLRLGPSRALADAVDIEIGGERYVACLGRTCLIDGRFALTAGADGWIELVSTHAQAFMNDVQLAANATLLTGDAIAVERGAPPVLRIL